MKSILVICIPALIVMAMSCVNHAQQQAISTIDSLIAVNTSVYREIEAIEIDSIQMMYDTVKEYNRFFATTQSIDSNIDASVLMLMYEYGTIDKTFKKFLQKHYSASINDLNTRRKQLENLKQDVENNLIDNERIKQYLQLEDSLMSFVAADIRGRIKQVEQHKEKYYRYHHEIVNLTDSLKNAIR